MCDKIPRVFVMRVKAYKNRPSKNHLATEKYVLVMMMMMMVLLLLLMLLNDGICFSLYTLANKNMRKINGSNGTNK